MHVQSVRIVAPRAASAGAGDRTTGLAWEILIVDNNSTDRDQKCRGRVRTTSTVRGRVRVRDQAGQIIRAEHGHRSGPRWVPAFADVDAVADREWLTAIAQGFADKNCMGIGGRIVQTWPAGKPAWLESLERTYPPMHVLATFDLGDAPQDCTMKTPPYGANVGFRRDVSRFGGFHDRSRSPR